MIRVLLELLLLQYSQAGGECVVAADCSVRSARCQEGRCTLQQSQFIFPELNLETIDLELPARLDRTNPRPEFHWLRPMGAGLIVAAVFNEPPEVSVTGDRILNFNSQSVSWVWHSNLGGVRSTQTRAVYQEGRPLRPDFTVGENAVDEFEAADLPPGQYSWAMWGWKSGVLSHQSELRHFLVGANSSVTGKNCGPKCGSLNNSRCYQRTFCVLACASNVDCFTGESCDLSTVSNIDLSAGVCRSPRSGCPCREGMFCDEALDLCYDDPYGTAGGGVVGCSCAVASSRALSTSQLIAVLILLFAIIRPRSV